MRVLVGAVMVMLAGGLAQGDERCKYAGQFFFPGAVACQTGQQYRCVSGEWQAVGSACADRNPEGDQPAVLDDPGNQAPAVRQPNAPGEPPVRPDQN
jgi:hypothetical protein